MLGYLNRFHTFVREERLFCTTLFHLLSQKGPNLSAFLDLVNSRLPEHDRINTGQLEDARIYVEFTFLRDYWNTFGRDNDRKRQFIFTLVSRVDALNHQTSTAFPTAIPEFNRFFMGDRGERILNDIVYPGQWSVSQLARQFDLKPNEFHEWCKFKWAFNIKPDMVVLLPDSPPLCVEAKLESREGWYPTAGGERNIFDRLFDVEKGRVGQIELQQFMFEKLLGVPCHSVLIGRTREPGLDVDAFFTWHEVFEHLDSSSSIPYIRQLIDENEHLRSHPQVSI